MGKIVFGAIMPHPPILVPEIGKKRIREAEKSKKSLEEIARRLKNLSLDTLIVFTPHGEVGYSSVPVYTSHIFEGNFGMFGVAKPSFSFKGDPALGLAIVKDCDFAIKQVEVEQDWFSCLITTNRQIIIGNHQFWDWEDDDLTNNQMNI